MKPSRSTIQFFTGLILLSLALGGLLLAAPAAVPTKSTELFQTKKIWTIHLKWTAAQWEAMEPKGGQRGPGGPGGFGGRGGPGGFGAGMFLTPGFMKGDADKDGKLSRAEFAKLGDSWFNGWDKEKSGALSSNQVSDGLNSTIEMPMMGPGVPGGGGPGPGGPGGGPREPGGGMQGRNGRNGASAMQGIDFEYVHADLDFEGQQLNDVAIRYKGNSTFMMSRNSLKKSMKLDLNKYTKGQKFAGITKFNLHSCATDDSYMNEVLSYQLFREANVPSPRTAYARVYVTVPGKHDKQYAGLYSVVEDVDKTFAEERFDQTKGAIFKPSTRSLFNYLGDDWEKYNQMYDPKTTLSKKQEKRVIEFSKFVTSATDEEFTKGLAGFLEIDEFARFMAATVWLANGDSILMMGQNYYVYLDPDTNKFSFLPWDLDLSFGKFMGAGAEMSINKPFQPQNKFLDRIFKVDAFKKPYLDALAKYNKTLFEPTRLTKLVDELAAVIRPAIKDESETKLTRFDKAIAGETSTAGGFGPPPGDGPGGPGGPPPDAGPGGPRGFGGPGGPMGGKPIKTFVGPRAQSVADQLAGKSEGSQGGGRGGPGGRGGFGGPGGGPGMMLSSAFVTAMDLDKDGKITRQEFQDTFAKWFEDWGGKNGALSEEQIRTGINKDLPMPRPPGGGLMPAPPPL